MSITAVLETCLYASDLEAAERFYGGVLGLAVFGREAGRHVFFRCGDAVFEPKSLRPVLLRSGSTKP